MRLLVRLDMAQASSLWREQLLALPTRIRFISALTDMVSIELSRSDLYKLKKFAFIRDYYEPRVGTYATVGDFSTSVMFTPHVKASRLKTNELVGWGETRIVSLDSGVNTQSVHVLDYEDFTGTGCLSTNPHGTLVVSVLKQFSRGAQLFAGKIGDEFPDEEALLKGLEWAVGKGAHIINLSCEFTKHSDASFCAICDTVGAIEKRGILVIVAAGNKGSRRENTIQCPACSPAVITVGALDDTGATLADYSSISYPGKHKPNILAPGSVTVDGVRATGTSFSAPCISGVLGAILNTVGGSARAWQIMRETADDLGMPTYKQGCGALNLERLVEVVKNEATNSAGFRQKES